MESTLNALGGILLKAVPTLLLVLFLHFYIKRMFFRPLQRVLDARRQATEGARELAEASLKRASAKAAEYEEAIRQARAGMLREQEQERQRMRKEQESAIQQVRTSTQAMVDEARRQIALDVEQSREGLARESEALAARITERVLGGGAHAA